MMPIVRMTLQRTMRSTIAWSLAMVAVMTLYSSFWPTFNQPDVLDAVLGQFPDGLLNAFGFQAMTTGGGYMNGTFFGVLGYFVGSAAVVAWGADAVGTSEESGDLELTLSHRVSRSQLMFEQVGALILRIVIVCAIISMAIAANNAVFDMGMSGGDIAAQVASFGSLLILFGCVALAAGAVTGRRGPALGAGAAIAVWAFLSKAIAAMKDSVAWLHRLSPFSWAYKNEPYANGFDWAGIGALLGTAAVVVVLGWLVFLRRDIKA